MRLPILALTLLALAVAGCSDADDGDAPNGGADSGSTTNAPMDSPQPPGAAQTVEVMAMNNAFTPQQVTLRVGDSVRWVTHDAVEPHNVVSSSEGNAFRSPDLHPTVPTMQPEYTHTFTTAGTVDYLCEYHPGMVGTLTVEA